VINDESSITRRIGNEPVHINRAAVDSCFGIDPPLAPEHGPPERDQAIQIFGVNDGPITLTQLYLRRLFVDYAEGFHKPG
jgi:hypothetical protein